MMRWAHENVLQSTASHNLVPAIKIRTCVWVQLYQLAEVLADIPPTLGIHRARGVSSFIKTPPPDRIIGRRGGSPPW
jgi:hypothetical protein